LDKNEQFALSPLSDRSNKEVLIFQANSAQVLVCINTCIAVRETTAMARFIIWQNVFHAVTNSYRITQFHQKIGFLAAGASLFDDGWIKG